MSNLFDLQGHRGCRGLMPENTIPAFLHALELRVTTLEMDLVISKDHKVVVSHEPWLSHEYCLAPDGKEIKEKEEKNFNLYRMNYEEIRLCDCGSKTHPRFPRQKKFPAFKPLFNEVIKETEKFAAANNLPPVYYNVEIKSTVEGDNIFHPKPENFSELVMEIIIKNQLQRRAIIQSFDLRPLRYLHERYPEIQLSLLIENDKTPEENIAALGFTPHIYSPDYILVNELLMKFCRERKMKVIPWTVNDKESAERLIGLGVDGIITDYPDLFFKN